MLVPTHTRASAEYAQPHSMLRYHPKDNDVHRNPWIFIVAASDRLAKQRMGRSDRVSSSHSPIRRGCSEALAAEVAA